MVKSISENKEIRLLDLLVPAIIFSMLIVLAYKVSLLFSYVAIGYAVFCLMGKTREFGIYFTVFLIPNITVFNSLGITFIVNILLAITLIPVFFLKQFKINVELFLGWLALLVMEFLHIAFLGNTANAISELSTFICLFVAMFVSTNACYRLSKRMIALALALGVIASSLMFFAIYPSYLPNLITNINMSQRFQAFTPDPNYFALYICMSAAMVVNLDKLKNFDYCVAIILVGIGLLTRSKMCYLLLAGIMLHFVFSNLLKINSKVGRRALMTMGMMIVVAFVFREQIGVLIDNVVARAGLSEGEFSLEQFTTGRSALFQNYLKILADNPKALFFGYGFQYHLFLGEETGHGAHNTFMDIILAWGVVGVFVFLFFMAAWIKEFKRTNAIQKKTANYIPLIVLCVGFLSLSCLSATMFGWILMVTMLSFKREEETVVFNDIGTNFQEEL